MRRLRLHPRAHRILGGRGRRRLSLAPGVVSPGLDPPGSGLIASGNAGVAEVVRDIEAFFGRLREVNRRVRVVLTVSPVPLLATFEDRHVPVSTVASKSILRAAVDEICRAHDDIAYSSVSEIITGRESRGRFHGPDLREVTPEGVGFVQAVFRRHFLDLGAGQAEAFAVPAPAPEGDASDPDLAGRARRYATLARAICDEEAIIHPGPAGGATRTRCVSRYSGFARRTATRTRSPTSLPDAEVQAFQASPVRGGGPDRRGGRPPDRVRRGADAALLG